MSGIGRTAICVIRLSEQLISVSLGTDMINGALIRAARALLGWSGKTLAERANIGTATLQRIEQANHIDASQFRTIQKIQHTLAEAGIRFLEDASGDIGVALTREKSQELQRREIGNLEIKR